jgi:hypothetical protein
MYHNYLNSSSIALTGLSFIRADPIPHPVRKMWASKQIIGSGALRYLDVIHAAAKR